MARLTRRRMVAGSATATAVGLALTIPVLAAAPDAEILHLCAEFDALERRISELYASGSSGIVNDTQRAEAQAPFKERQKVLLDQICEARDHPGRLQS